MNEKLRATAHAAATEAWQRLYPDLADADCVATYIADAVLAVVKDAAPAVPDAPASYLDLPWQTGRSVGRTIYAQSGDDKGVLIGVMDTPGLAQHAAEAHNRLLLPQPLRPPREPSEKELEAFAEAIARTSVTRFVSQVVDVPEHLISGPETHTRSMRAASGAVRYPHLLYQVMLQPDGKLALFDHGTDTFVAYNSTPDSVLGHIRAVSQEGTSHHALKTIASVLTGDQPMVGAVDWDRALQLDEENAGHSWPALKLLDTASFTEAPALAVELFGPVPEEYLDQQDSLGQGVTDEGDNKSSVDRPCPQEDL